MRRLLLILLAALAALTAWLLPPRAPDLPLPAGDTPVRGIVHVHSRRSDGSGTVEAIASAAARAGLQFVVFTDHGDGTRQPDPPVFRSGVLCIDAVEVSTFGGHVVGIGLPMSPYPLGGEPADVVEDIHRLGGVAIAAHPTSPRSALAWHDWDVPVDGIEWLNGDTEWRDESPWMLARVLLTYPWRGPESLALLLDAPDDALQQWDALSRARPVFTLAVPDAHASIGLPGSTGDERAPLLALPSYERVFRSLSVTLDGVRLTGDAGADATAVVSALRAGHLHSTVDGLARGMTLRFSSTQGSRTAREGDRLPPGTEPVVLQVAWTAPAGSQARLLNAGQLVQNSPVSPLTWTVPPDRAAYRVEVQAPGDAATRHLIVSNPIYVGWPPDGPTPAAPPAPRASAEGRVLALGEAQLERSASAVAALDHDAPGRAPRLTLRFGLGGTKADAPYAAAAFDLGPAGLGAATHVRLTAQANPAMRVSLQLRDAEGHRWRRSVYIDEQGGSVDVPLETFRAVGGERRRLQVGQAATTLLLVVDTTNTAVGGSGQLRMTNVSLEP